MRSSLDATRERLRVLLHTLSYEEREVVLASGQKSSFYVDVKQTALTGEGHALIGRLFFARLVALESAGAGPFAAVAGMSIGADPLSSSLALTAHLAGRELTAIYVRKEAKGHGTGAYLEGTKSVPAGARVVLVEDVVTTGGSTLSACARVRDAGFVVTDVLAILDRAQGGRENLAKEGLALHALFTLDDIRSAQ